MKPFQSIDPVVRFILIVAMCWYSLHYMSDGIYFQYEELLRKCAIALRVKRTSFAYRDRERLSTRLRITSAGFTLSICRTQLSPVEFTRSWWPDILAAETEASEWRLYLWTRSEERAIDSRSYHLAGVKIVSGNIPRAVTASTPSQCGRTGRLP